MIINQNYIKVQNAETVRLSDLQIISYELFYTEVISLLSIKSNHCVEYFAFKKENDLQFLMAIADDENNEIFILSHVLKHNQMQELFSITLKIPAIQIFEREIHEQFGINFIEHPWLKPVRYSFNRFNKLSVINNYPFYKIDGENLHEVSVGPIHAGIIEPGLFRFTCNGERVLHLEIHLGWQHRGIEQLFIEKEKMLQKNILAENIAGDTAVSHTSAFVQAIESLAGIQVSEQLQIERALAAELERIAIHTADIGALCVDAAFNLGANIFGILRTGIINFTQLWCGNRLGKSLIRIGGTNFPFTESLKEELIKVLDKYEKMFIPLSHNTYRKASIQNRFDFVGSISTEQAFLNGNVGMSAKMSNLMRDIRNSHPYFGYKKFPIEIKLLEKGDVFGRFLLRRKEIKSSIAWIRNLLEKYNFEQNNFQKPNYSPILQPESLVISLTEGWRGEICHAAITDKQGKIEVYKVKDPSMQNWKSLELSLRNVDISDFPINNKSYNLSYCGSDL